MILRLFLFAVVCLGSLAAGAADPIDVDKVSEKVRNDAASEIPSPRWFAAYLMTPGLNVDTGESAPNYLLSGESVGGAKAFFRTDVTFQGIEIGHEISEKKLPEAVRRAWQAEIAGLKDPVAYRVRKFVGGPIVSDRYYHLQGEVADGTKTLRFTLAGEAKSEAVVVPQSSRPAEAPDGFAELKPEGARFRILMPAKPEAKVEQAKRPDGSTVTSYQYVAQPLRDVRFRVQYFDFLPADLPGDDTPSRLQKFLRATLAGAPGETLEEEAFERGLTVGRRVLHQFRELGVREEIYVVGNRLYRAAVYGPIEYLVSKDVDRYFDSFEIVP